MYRFGLIVLLLSMFTLSPIHAYDNVRIGVVNIAAVEQSSTAWQKKLVELQAQFDSNRKSIAQEEQNLKERINDYEKQRPLLSVEQQQEKESEINQQVAALQNRAAELSAQLDQHSTTSRQALRVKIAENIDQLAEKYDLDIIFEAGEENFSIVFFSERLDLTAEISTNLNKNYQIIKIQ